MHFLNFHSSEIPGSSFIICTFGMVSNPHTYWIIHLRQLPASCMEHVISAWTIAVNEKIIHTKEYKPSELPKLHFGWSLLDWGIYVLSALIKLSQTPMLVNNPCIVVSSRYVFSPARSYSLLSISPDTRSES